MRSITVRPIQPPTAQRIAPWRWIQTMMLCSCTLLLILPACVAAGSNPVAPVGCSAAAGTCVRIGIWLCPNPATCGSVPGHDRLTHWYKDRVAAKGGTWHGVPVYWVELELEGFFLSTTQEIATKINDSFIGPAAWAGTGGPLVDFTILPFGSLWDTGMPLLERWRIPSVGALSPDSRLFQCAANATIWRSQVGCTAPNTRRFQYAHGTPNSGEQYFESWVGMLKRQKARSVALVRTTIPFYLGVHDGIMTAAGDNHIDITYDTVALLTGSPPALQPETVRRIIAEMQSLPEEPDGVAFLTQDCIPWIRGLRAANFAPKSVAAILCSDSTAPLEQLRSDLNYIVGSSQWAVGLTGADYTEDAVAQPWALFPAETASSSISGGVVTSGGVAQAEAALTSPLLFQATYRDIMNSTTIVPGYADAGVLAAFEFLEGSVSLAGSVDPELVQAQLKSFYQPSFYGLLSTNRFGQNNAKQLVINQRDDTGALQIISPTYAATGDFLYPLPLWSERTYAHSMFASTIERVLIALLLACSVGTGLLMVWLFRNRHNQKWPAAKAGFWIVQGFGCLLAYAAVLTWPVENDSHTCSARIWLWTLAFHLFVDPLLTSSYFIAAVARQQLEVSKLSTQRLGLGCLALLAPQLLINILWASLAPLSPQVVTGDPIRPAHTSFTTCAQTGDSHSDSVGFAAVTLAYSCLLLLVGCALAYRVRPAHRIYSDAKTITSTVYFFFVTAAVVLVVQVTLRNDDVSDQRVLFGLRSVGALIAYQGSIALLYLRRILDVRAAISAGRTQHPIRTSQIGFSLQAGEPALARSPAAEATAVALPPAKPAAAGAALGSGAGPVPAIDGAVAARSTRLTPPGHSPAGTLPPGTVTPHSALVLPRHDLSSDHHSSSAAAAAALSPPPPLPDRADLMALSTEESISLVHSYWSAIQAATASIRRKQQMQLLSAAASSDDDAAQHDGDGAGGSPGSFTQMLRGYLSQSHPQQQQHYSKQRDEPPVRLHGLAAAAMLATPTGEHNSSHLAAPLPPGATPNAAAAASAAATPAAAAPIAEEIELAPYPDAAALNQQRQQSQSIDEECKGPAQLNYD